MTQTETELDAFKMLGIPKEERAADTAQYLIGNDEDILQLEIAREREALDRYATQMASAMEARAELEAKLRRIEGNFKSLERLKNISGQKIAQLNELINGETKSYTKIESAILSGELPRNVVFALQAFGKQGSPETVTLTVADIERITNLHGVKTTYQNLHYAVNNSQLFIREEICSNRHKYRLSQAGYEKLIEIL